MAVLSDQLDGKGKYVPDTTLGSYDARRTRIVLELAPEPKDLHIDAAIKHVFVNPRRLQEMLTGERSLRRIEECSQKRVLAFRQCDRGAARVRQASRATIELPTAKSAATLLQLLSRGDATRLPPTQYSPDARDEFAQTERLGHIVIGAVVPGGRWLTTMSMPSWLASFCSSRFHSRTRDPLLPPPPAFAGAGLAVISNRVALG